MFCFRNCICTTLLPIHIYFHLYYICVFISIIYLLIYIFIYSIDRNAFKTWSKFTEIMCLKLIYLVKKTLFCIFNYEGINGNACVRALPTVAFLQLSSNICCPRDCISRHKGGTAGAPLKPLRDDSALLIKSTFFSRTSKFPWRR